MKRWILRLVIFAWVGASFAAEPPPLPVIDVQCDFCSPPQTDSFRTLVTHYLLFYRENFGPKFSAAPLPVRILVDRKENPRTETHQIVIGLDSAKTPDWVIDDVLRHELGHWMFDHDPENPFAELTTLEKSETELDAEDTRWWNQGQGEDQDGPHRAAIRALREKGRERALEITGCADDAGVFAVMDAYSSLDELVADLLDVVYDRDLDRPEKVEAFFAPKVRAFRSFAVRVPNTPAYFEKVRKRFDGTLDTHVVLSPSRAAIGARFAPLFRLDSHGRGTAAVRFAHGTQSLFRGLLRGCKVPGSVELNQKLLEYVKTGGSP